MIAPSTHHHHELMHMSIMVAATVWRMRSAMCHGDYDHYHVISVAIVDCEIIMRSVYHEDHWITIL